MSNLVIYYINLDNRQDKEFAAKNQLAKTSFPFQRINAIKFTEEVDSEIPYKYFRLISNDEDYLSIARMKKNIIKQNQTFSSDRQRVV